MERTLWGAAVIQQSNCGNPNALPADVIARRLHDRRAIGFFAGRVSVMSDRALRIKTKPGRWQAPCKGKDQGHGSTGPGHKQTNRPQPCSHRRLRLPLPTMGRCRLLLCRQGQSLGLSIFAESGINIV